MSTMWEVLVPAVTALLGAGGATALANSYWAHSRQKIIDGQAMMREMYEQLLHRLTVVEASEKECVEAKEKLTLDIGRLGAEVAGLRQQLDNYLDQEIPISVRTNAGGLMVGVRGPIEKTMGLSKYEVLGKHIEILMPPYARAEAREAFARAAEKDAADLRNVTLNTTHCHTKWGNRQCAIIINSSTENGEKVFDAEIHVERL